uniref:Uncharacterized protein n=1 Tax=Triticum urartu TaxID=4572 RepID=A0A8R7TFC1_TRIUA
PHAGGQNQRSPPRAGASPAAAIKARKQSPAQPIYWSRSPPPLSRRAGLPASLRHGRRHLRRSPATGWVERCSMIRFIGLLLLGLISLLHRNFSPGAFQFRELNLTLQIIRQHSTLLRKGTSENIFLSLVETELKITPFRLGMADREQCAHL